MEGIIVGWRWMVDGAKRECERMRRASVDSERQAAAGRASALISRLSVASGLLDDNHALVTPNYLPNRQPNDATTVSPAPPHTTVTQHVG